MSYVLLGAVAKRFCLEVGGRGSGAGGAAVDVDIDSGVTPRRRQRTEDVREQCRPTKGANAARSESQGS